MAHLSDFVAVNARFSRSANLERDAGQTDPLDGYIVTAQALNVIDRIASTAATGHAGGAWSLTGPYGTGKSSFALLLDAAFGPSSDLRARALDAVKTASPNVASRIDVAHTRHSTTEDGFNRGLVTAQREPLSHTVLRALEAAARNRWGRLPTVRQFPSAEALRGAIADAAIDDPRRTGPSPSVLVDIARDLARDRPLLLVIDEFGKNLESIRDDHGAQADPYLLQQLSEAGQGAGLPIFLVTLQHLSFEDYLFGTDQSMRQEWAKVQGRFDDIAFTDTASQTRRLIGSVFDAHDAAFHRRIKDWASVQATQKATLGIQEIADRQTIADCYPLHPLTALVLPELCSRLGQNERTLFAFLAGFDERSAASFLQRTEAGSGTSLPTLGLSDAFEYFVGSAAPLLASTGPVPRLAEIGARLRDVTGLTEEERRLAQCIGLLNTVSTSGTIRASRSLLCHLSTDADSLIRALEAKGVITYREFADEYRVWQGSDLNLDRLLELARGRIRSLRLVDVIGSIRQPSPVVAARQSAEHETLRVFSRLYVDDGATLEPVPAQSPFDGQVVLVVGDRRLLPVAERVGPHSKPIVAALPSDLSVLDAAAREYAMVVEVLDEPQVQADWVVRRELSERLAQVSSVLDNAVQSTFDSESCRWVLLDGGTGVELPPGRGSSPLSAAAGRVYSDTPLVRNEMLNRAELTSQGAKTRRVLLEAMIENGSEPGLGFEGFGPEVAMYRSVLRSTGIHGPDAKSESWIVRPPNDKTMKGAWKALTDEFKRAKSNRVNLDDIFATLMSPPYGMKAGVVPVVVTAGLLAAQDEVAIYEHGTFRPALTPELSERMVRNPGHFEVKHFANTTGARRQVVESLASKFGVQPTFRKQRVANVLAIVGRLVSQLRRLENFVVRTSHLSPETLKVREALLTAVEPDELLFESLPAALGLKPVPTETKTYSRRSDFAERLAEALAELSDCYGQLLQRLHRNLLEACAEKHRRVVVGHAAAVEDEVLDPEIRAFVLTLANDGVETDEDWIQAIATVVSKKAPAEWTDEDLTRFNHILPTQVAAFLRLSALHADARAHGGGPFEAVRVVITPSDGNEYTRLVELERDSAVDESLDGVINALGVELGSPARAEQALLAALSERLLSTRARNREHDQSSHADEEAKSA